MEMPSGRRNAALGIVLAWCAYIAFALLTDWKDYGLEARTTRYPTWIVIRLATVSMWLVVATLLLRYRKSPVIWRSFSYSFIATGIAAILIAPSLVNSGANEAVIAGTILIYALVSGFLCVTVARPGIAAALSAVLFALQLGLDGILHTFAYSGSTSSSG